MIGYVSGVLVLPSSDAQLFQLHSFLSSDYYNIEDVKYNCYLYAYFVNGKWHMFEKLQKCLNVNLISILIKKTPNTGNHPTFYQVMTKAYRKVLKFFSS